MFIAFGVNRNDAGVFGEWGEAFEFETDGGAVLEGNGHLDGVAEVDLGEGVCVGK